MLFCPQCRMPFEENSAACGACGAVIDRSRDALIGMTLSGGYVIEACIGAGAMAKVYRAEQTNLGRTVAVKVMHAHLMHDETTGRRFINEARAASRLNHPHSLSVIDFGHVETGQPYMVMEYLRGRDLQRVVEEEGPLSFARIVDILLQLLDALSEAHEMEIIHRDLKPENIVIEPVRAGGDYVKVVDFGLAKIMNARQDMAITATGTVCGTPDFMSPEQCRGDKLDARSDLYAVGVILFVLLTGQVPFVATTPTQALLLHLTAPAPDPRKVAPGRLIPEELAVIALKALEKKPEGRFSTARAFAEALDAARRELRLTAASDPVPSRATTVRCPSCGGFAPQGTKFCVECGEPVSFPEDGTIRKRIDRTSAVSSQLSFIGRDTALVALLDPLQDPKVPQAGTLIRGEPGVGKTRLVQEFEYRAQRRGHRVVRVGPDPWHLGVACHGLREAIRALAGLPEDGGSTDAWSDASPSVQQGLAHVFGRPSACPKPSVGCRTACRDALAWAIAEARRPNGWLVLVFDDLPIFDGVSRRAIRDVLEASVLPRLLIVGTSTPEVDLDWPETTTIIDLDRLPPGEAALVIEQSGMSGQMLELPRTSVTPLYLDQALRFSAEATGSAPPRLGDLVEQRLLRLETSPRRSLQAIAVLGYEASISDIRQLIGPSRQAGEDVAALVEAGIIRPDEGTCRFCHGLVRDITLSTIPAGVYRELCGKALAITSGKSLPPEARVEYLIGAEETFEALLLLDQVGTAALASDDPHTAVEAYRRGLDLARDELARGVIDDPMGAVVLFGRKLGEALTAAGRPEDGEGVLREALGFAEPGSRGEALLMLSIARAAICRAHVTDAVRWAKQASGVASRTEDADLRASIDELLDRWGG